MRIVHCSTKEEAVALFAELEQQGYSWLRGHPVSSNPKDPDGPHFGSFYPECDYIMDDEERTVRVKYT